MRNLSKTGPKLSKTSPNTGPLQATSTNTVPTVPNSAKQCHNASVFHTPRFSYDIPETAVRTCPHLRVRARRQGGTGPWVRWGRVYRVGTWGLYRVQYPPSTLLARRAYVQRSGPGRPCRGLEWWYIWPGAPAGPCTTPAGPGRSPAEPSLDMAQLPGKRRLLANKVRFSNILLKVSQNGEVSTIFHQKACHSPYFQNRLRMSPLEILRFPVWPAFSHKELMGHFRPYRHVYCQNDEVSPNVHPNVPAKCAPDTPTRHVSKLTPVPCSSSGLARSPRGILNASVLGRFLGDYD